MTSHHDALPPPLTEAQLEIMDIVWQRDEVTVADVWKTLAQTRDVSRNTIQTLMTRLDERGWLVHRADGNTFYYQAAHPRDAAQQDLVRKLIDSAFGGSAEGLVMTLLDSGVTPEEAARIRKRIQQAAKGKL